MPVGTHSDTMNLEKAAAARKAAREAAARDKAAKEEAEIRDAEIEKLKQGIADHQKQITDLVPGEDDDLIEQYQAKITEKQAKIAELSAISKTEEDTSANASTAADADSTEADATSEVAELKESTSVEDTSSAAPTAEESELVENTSNAVDEVSVVVSEDNVAKEETTANTTADDLGQQIAALEVQIAEKTKLVNVCIEFELSDQLSKEQSALDGLNAKIAELKAERDSISAPKDAIAVQEEVSDVAVPTQDDKAAEVSTNDTAAEISVSEAVLNVEVIPASDANAHEVAAEKEVAADVSTTNLDTTITSAEQVVADDVSESNSPTASEGGNQFDIYKAEVANVLAQLEAAAHKSITDKFDRALKALGLDNNDNTSSANDAGSNDNLGGEFGFGSAAGKDSLIINEITA